MTKLQRFQSILASLFQLLFAVLILFFSDLGYGIITALISFSLLLSAIREFRYYFSMARYMVGGKRMLYRALIMTDLAFLSLSIAQIPTIYIQIYLVAIFGFSGFVDLMRALEARRGGASSWKLNAFHSAFNLLMAILCLCFIRFGRVTEILYVISLVNSAILRLITAFRRTAIIYIA
ncbi:MAG: hypothetical protein J6P72_09215 [Firmicutes bacterium]|nr:hypothetical protein [Bacillota bacterium]